MKTWIALMMISAACGSNAAFAVESGDMLLRVKAVAVHPQESAKITPTGGKLSASTAFTPGVDVSWFIDKNIAVEFVPGLVRHHAKIKGSTRGDKDLGAVWAIAPMLLLQYHTTRESGIKPYVGMGLTYVTYLEDTSVDVEYDDDIGGILQLGLDVPLDKEQRWWATMDIKKIWVGTESDFNQGKSTGEITLNPVTAALGIGYRF